MRYFKATSWLTALFCAIGFSVYGQTGDLQNLKTRAEKSGYEETSSYQDVMDFVNVLAIASDVVHLTSFGKTVEGRDLPLIVLGAKDATPEAVLAENKVRAYVQGNIHAGEVCGKEALQMFLREYALGQHRALTDSLVLLIAPIYNADGNERVDLKNRPRQHGPLKGMGQRPNAQNYDLNRDHMKLDSPEAHALVGLFNAYDPQVIMDLHTTNGSYHAYHLTYASPLNPNTPEKIDAFLREKWLPAITRDIKQKYGWNYYYYGNLPWRGMNAERGWYTFDHRPRFNNNYAGLRNRFGILSEAYSYATFEDRVKATLYFVQDVLAFAHGHASEIRAIAAEADRQNLIGTTLALRAQMAKSGQPVDILMGEVVEEKNPYSGEVILRRQDVSRVEKMYEYGTFSPTLTGIVPEAYFIPPTQNAVLALVEAHGIRHEKLDAAQILALEQFRIDSVQVGRRPFQGHEQATVSGSYEKTNIELPAGTVKVPLDQPLARLVFYLLEPQSDDGVAAWDLLEPGWREAQDYPILRDPAK
ncbi:MAG: M14 family metallopeptidase [Deferribacteres bacterium]|nr:M14 family metallopeptidase [candidate division KSB1 bacterium]MCB9512136.1 M14 family metallopeptidase [Deferribacteres bacterium]